MKFRHALALTALLALSSFGYGWSPPALLSQGTSTTLDFDRSVAVAANASGQWGALWTSNAPTLLDFGIPFRSSSDSGASWTSPYDVSFSAGIPYDGPAEPTVAVAGNVWIAAWSATEHTGKLIREDRDIWFSRSLDGGNNWSVPQQLNADHSDARFRNHEPSLATDGNGVWTVVWLRSPNDGLASSLRPSIMSSRSTNNGSTWSAPEPLAECSDTQEDGPRVASNAGGDWVAVWSSDAFAQTSTTRPPKSIYYSKCEQGSTTWSLAARLTFEDSTVAGGSHTPCLASGPGNQWVAVWAAGTVTTTVGFRSWPDSDLFAAVSVDGGLTWSQPTVVNSDGLVDSRQDMEPTVAWNGTGFHVVWSSSPDGLAISSSSTGTSWSPVSHPFSLDAANATVGARPALARDGNDRLVLTWVKRSSPDRESDVYYSALGPSAASDWQLYGEER